MNGTIAPPGKSGRVTMFARAAATLFFIGAPALMHASALVGNLSLSSHGTETIAVNGSMIDFDYSGGVNATSPPTAASTGMVDGSGDGGLFDITNASTMSFGGALINTTVTVHDLDSSQEPIGTTSGAMLPLSSFLTFSAQPGWNVTLTEILPGVAGSPAGSPFNLIDEGGGQVLVGFAFLATATDGLGDTSYGAGTFSTTFSSTSVASILAALNGGAAVVSSANATISFTTIPEPASVFMLLSGSGLIAIPAIRRRRRQRT